MVYIVHSGEFQVSKKFTKEVDNSSKINHMLQTRQHTRVFEAKETSKNLKNTLASHKLQAQKQSNIKSFDLGIMGPGQIFGEEDVLSERNYTKTVVSKSDKGLLYCMKAAEFYRRLKANDECWKIILF